jgi:transglutaminase-like putative cysteine protease
VSSSGLALDRSAFEITTINYRRRRTAGGGGNLRSAGIVPRTAIGAGVEPARAVTSMRVRLTTERGPWSLAADSTAGFQGMEGDVAVMSEASPDSTVDPAPDTTMAPWLADAPRFGVEDPVIAGRVRTILGDERDPRRMAARLVAWVSDSISRSPNPLVPRAATVLRERQADVDGHTLLLVALARAAGLPARPVSGILLAGGKFYFHSWAEVFLGTWVPVDPTWGEIPASANRIRMGIGILARPLDLLPLVAGLDAELISLTQRP